MTMNEVKIEIVEVPNYDDFIDLVNAENAKQVSAMLECAEYAKPMDCSSVKFMCFQNETHDDFNEFANDLYQDFSQEQSGLLKWFPDLSEFSEISFVKIQKAEEIGLIVTL